ncbi:MAG: DEAD/DEAH box helicase [Planctomycetota bacterium]|jgi:SNF2 family DNA or RNA helicase
MLVVHANWTDGTLRLWAESLPRYLEAVVARPAAGVGDGAVERHAVVGGGEGGGTAVLEADHTGAHPFAASVDELVAALVEHLRPPDTAEVVRRAPAGTMGLRLPSDPTGPVAGDRLAAAAGALDVAVEPRLGRFTVPCVVLEPADTLAVLISLETCGESDGVEFGHDLQYWVRVGRFALELLASQRFIPTVVQSASRLRAQWQPWLHDDGARDRIGMLIESMPPVIRAVDDEHGGQPWPILDEALRTIVDRTVRTALIAESFEEAVDGRDPQSDLHVAWLSGLLGARRDLLLPADLASDLLRDVGAWVGRLDMTGQEQPFRLCLRLNEPVDSESLAELQAVDADIQWRLSFHLRSADDDSLVIDAEKLWTRGVAAGGVVTGGANRPDEVLLTELGRAAQVYPSLETALASPQPTQIDLTTAQAYELVSDYRPLLEESGFDVDVPEWWEDPTSQLAARLLIKADPLEEGMPVGTMSATRPSRLGLSSLVEYRWQIALGEEPLTEAEFERLRRCAAPLVRLRGRWVRLQREQLEAAQQLLLDQPDGPVTLLQAIQLAHAHGADAHGPSLPVMGMDATGWVGDLLAAVRDPQRMPEIEQPETLQGSLRPYQRVGLSWLAFLDRLGLGACLADDMGLGKTIQLISLLLWERPEAGVSPGPTLLLVPTSLIGNWTRELNRFAPNLRIHVHHGPDRPVGHDFQAAVSRADIIITTYGLVTRDRADLDTIQWRRVVLDEAQFIKNPPTKQTSAIRALNTERRVALTGTPVENRLSELWSIMEFCNPGYLGPAAAFRRRFAVPIERHRDESRADLLRRLVRPFVLRRLKTDPTVIDDLPPCVQTKEYATLTPEQAAMYQRIVDGMLNQVDRAEGIKRRGLVLAALVRLKQVCDHPQLVLDAEQRSPVVGRDTHALADRSGKAQRLINMLEQVRATGERALIFTQFRQMGHLLAAMIQHELDSEVQFMHGGTPPARRQQMVDRFQDPDSGSFAFVCSLKAGGVGLNLTAASHVFHYDRWWNPAVENQATDRAFRIGQTRTVHVHKFVCSGTLEERIDQMIEDKTELARNIIGSGEQWLSQMSSNQLREVLTLRQDAMELDG